MLTPYGTVSFINVHHYLQTEYHTIDLLFMVYIKLLSFIIFIFLTEHSISTLKTLLELIYPTVVCAIHTIYIYNIHIHREGT